MPITPSQIVSSVVSIEGGYSENPSDPGGCTKYGITERVARANGYTGDMRDLTRPKAVDIYQHEYFIRPGFDKVYTQSPAIAAELFEAGVNMGIHTVSVFLQRSLNALNRGGKAYADVRADGNVGPATITALNLYLRDRGEEGEHVLLKCLNVLQGARYIELAEKNPSLEAFTYGWINNRVSMSA